MVGQKIAASVLLILGIVFSAITCAGETNTKSRSSGDRVVYRSGYLHGYSPMNPFILQDAESGFLEIQTLFLGSLSAAESIEKCCSKTPRKNRISLYLREPYYVVLQGTPVLITSLDLIWSRSFGVSKPYLVLNQELRVNPSADSESFALLLRWAKERGYK